MNKETWNILERNFISPEDCAMRLIRKGGNNRLYTVEHGSKKFVLKENPRQVRTAQFRLLRETEFLLFAGKYAKTYVPSLIDYDLQSGLTLMSFEEGTDRFDLLKQPESLNGAVNFYKSLNGFASAEDKAKLRFAAEACFSRQEYIHSMEKRLSDITSITVEDDLTERIKNISVELTSIWKQVKLELEKASNWELETKTVQQKFSQLCVSPSDFGFHNAILTKDNRIKFIDFEYAGLDDPAKLICDFFEQVAVPVPHKLKHRFMSDILEGNKNREQIVEREFLLRPFFKLKWICIILNIFINRLSVQEKLAGQFEGQNISVFKENQIEKALLKLKEFKKEYTQYG